MSLLRRPGAAAALTAAYALAWVAAVLLPGEAGDWFFTWPLGFTVLLAATLRARGPWPVAPLALPPLIAAVVSVAATAAAGGDLWPAALAGARTGLVDIAAAVLFVETLRRGTGAIAYPTRGWAMVHLLVAGGVVAAAAAALRGLPAWPSDLTWLAAACAAFADVSWITWLGLALGHPLTAHTRLRRAVLLPAVAALAVVIVGVVGRNPALPLSWLLMVPTVAAGLLLTPRTGTLALVAYLWAIRSIPVLVPAWTEGHETVHAPLLEVSATVIVAVGLALIALREGHETLSAAEERAAREAVADSSLLGAVIATMTDGVLLLGAGGDVVLSNPGARALLGAPVAPAAQSWIDRYGVRTRSGADVPEHLKARLDSLGGLRDDVAPAEENTELSVPAPDGGRRVLTVDARPLADPDLAALVLLSDVTQSAERLRELETFAGVIAHDLRNPLGAVSLWVDTAELEVGDGGDVAAGHDALDHARQASRRMREVIDDYLAYTIGREGVLRPTSVSLAAVISEIVEVYAGAGARGGPTFEIDADVRVRADRTLVRQLLANVISNAVKYARPGHRAYVRVRALPEDPPGWVRILVEDKGIGIDDGDAETMFAEFGRTARGAAVQQGTGLGLALCRSIVHRHGGTIGARRNQWGGTTIDILLPASDDPRS